MMHEEKRPKEEAKDGEAPKVISSTSTVPSLPPLVDPNPMQKPSIFKMAFDKAQPMTLGAEERGPRSLSIVKSDCAVHMPPLASSVSSRRSFLDRIRGSMSNISIALSRRSSTAATGETATDTDDDDEPRLVRTTQMTKTQWATNVLGKIAGFFGRGGGGGVPERQYDGYDPRDGYIGGGAMRFVPQLPRGGGGNAYDAREGFVGGGVQSVPHAPGAAGAAGPTQPAQRGVVSTGRAYRPQFPKRKPRAGDAPIRNGPTFDEGCDDGISPVDSRASPRPGKGGKKGNGSPKAAAAKGNAPPGFSAKDKADRHKNVRRQVTPTSYMNFEPEYSYEGKKNRYYEPCPDIYEGPRMKMADYVSTNAEAFGKDLATLLSDATVVKTPPYQYIR